jgi:hypothetical protein
VSIPCAAACPTPRARLYDSNRPDEHGDRSPGFGLTKTCESYLLCTVETSNLEAIPAGTQITYTYNGDGSDGLAYPTIRAKDSTATGVRDWNQAPGAVLAKCTFGAGTGSLERLHLDIDVTVVGDPNDAASVWHWDGTYWFGDGN